MHILASGPEEQAVYFGYAFHLDVKIPPPNPKRFKSFSIVGYFPTKNCRGVVGFIATGPSGKSELPSQNVLNVFIRLYMQCEYR
jgi:hypothetical protein